MRVMLFLGLILTAGALSAGKPDAKLVRRADLPPLEGVEPCFRHILGASLFAPAPVDPWAMAADEGQLWFWNLQHGAKTPIHLFRSPITAMAVSPTQDSFAVGFENGSAVLYRGHGDSPLKLEGGEAPSSSGRTRPAEHPAFWKAISLIAPPATNAKAKQTIQFVSFTPDGRLVATGADMVRTHDVNSGEVVDEFPAQCGWGYGTDCYEKNRAGYGVQFIPDPKGKTPGLALVDSFHPAHSREIALWKLNANPLKNETLDSATWRTLFGPPGVFGVKSFAEGTGGLQLWQAKARGDFYSLGVIPIELWQHQARMAFSPSLPLRVVIASYGYTEAWMELWDLGSQLRADLSKHHTPIRVSMAHPVDVMAFSPSGRWFASAHHGDQRSYVQLRDAETFEVLGEFEASEYPAVEELAFSPNEGFVFARRGSILHAVTIAPWTGTVPEPPSVIVRPSKPLALAAPLSVIQAPAVANIPSLAIAGDMRVVLPGVKAEDLSPYLGAIERAMHWLRLSPPDFRAGTVFKWKANANLLKKKILRVRGIHSEATETSLADKSAKAAFRVASLSTGELELNVVLYFDRLCLNSGALDPAASVDIAAALAQILFGPVQAYLEATPPQVKGLTSPKSVSKIEQSGGNATGEFLQRLEKLDGADLTRAERERLLVLLK